MNGLPHGYEPSELPALHSASPPPYPPPLAGEGREGAHLHDGAPLHRRSRENWRKAEVLIPNGCPSIPLRTGARLLPG